ncbi:thiamine pyrophosphate-dependent enzyme [Calothrix sp. UHCC 0171]|uniref:thiamine pyrophosphate-dependent enzyme n=1 Tax=Calothrix sp. UHCC 0171 TaxID=3110245 RepID=UPI002B1F74F2|nr:thiamine pyrophosphate-dependent enzyme [Calothrix sp. UHCC 0171]MEA5571202.1 thiamine pyrophosphate-dependent enzyme [Calothrix sp. UHCC 0171]
MLLTDKNLLNKTSNQKKSLTKTTNKQLIETTVADSIVQMLTELGVRHAFGVGGGAIAPMWEALEKSSIDVLHFRHEAGAAFAAIEAYFANNSPVAVFTTTGPGIINALTGMAAARYDGAKVILISACTSETNEGKWAFQETSLNTMPEELFSNGKLFHYAHCIKSSNELPEIAEQLAVGFSQPGGFVAHLSIPTDVQTRNAYNIFPDKSKLPLFIPDNKVINQVSELLSAESFAIWVGFGARKATKEILQLAERTGAAVMSSPRGKGIFPEKHPQYLGVTGFAGHESVLEYMESTPPQRILVLGTRLGEFTSFWNPAMIPPKGFIHVDIDSQVPGASYPNANTFPVIADVKRFLSLLLGKLSIKQTNSLVQLPPKFNTFTLQEENGNSETDLIRPQVLMSAIQKVIVEGSNAIVIAEAGNSFAWTTHHLKFHTSKCWRVSTGFAAMGHATTGVIGAAIANGGKAVAVVGDGAMLMNNEINTAVQYNIPAVWIVLNDSSYNMCSQGMKKLGYGSANTQISPTDFVMLARSMGADGICVESESQIETALRTAINSKVPFVVDVKIDISKFAPIGRRLNNLIKETAN